MKGVVNLTFTVREDMVKLIIQVLLVKRDLVYEVHGAHTDINICKE